MPASTMSSRQRMLNSINWQSVDHTPCSFMMFNALKKQCATYEEFIEKQISLGLDTFVEIPLRPPVVVNDYYNLHGLPVSYHPDVKVREWSASLSGEEWPILVKEYQTPAGSLTAEVRKTPDWRWGNHVPFLDDYIAPRSRKFLINDKNDLDALTYLLQSPTPEEITCFKREAELAKAFASRYDLFVTGGWGVGADMLGWVYGLERMMYTVFDQPDLVNELLNLIADWNRTRMRVILEEGVDLFIKRAWYENCDFWSPRHWRNYIYPILRADVDLAHEYGVKFGYLITSNCMPLLNGIREAHVDVVIGADPAAWDLQKAKDIMNGETALWGGVNGHRTVEMGSSDQVRDEVHNAMEMLAPGSGFILSPVDNVREDTPQAMGNVDGLINEWKKLINQKE